MSSFTKLRLSIMAKNDFNTFGSQNTILLSPRIVFLD